VPIAAAQLRTQACPGPAFVTLAKTRRFCGSSMKGPVSARQGEPAASGSPVDMKPAVAAARAGALSAFDIGTRRATWRSWKCDGCWPHGTCTNRARASGTIRKRCTSCVSPRAVSTRRSVCSNKSCPCRCRARAGPPKPCCARWERHATSTCSSRSSRTTAPGCPNTSVARRNL